jgi:protein Mpv17
MNELKIQGTTQLNNSLLKGVAVAADTFWRNSPYTAAAIVCGVKGSAADYIAQRNQNKKKVYAGTLILKAKKIDLRRNIAYVLYGSLYLGVALEYIYNHIYPKVFGSGVDPVTIMSKVAFDMMFHSTLLTLPISYMSKAVIFKYSFKEAISLYVDDIKNHKLLLKYYTLWVPVMTFAYKYVPEHFRVSFMALVSFFWLIMLSSIANKAPVLQDDE